jgi:hypothetical protein
MARILLENEEIRNIVDKWLRGLRGQYREMSLDFVVMRMEMLSPIIQQSILNEVKTKSTLKVEYFSLTAALKSSSDNIFTFDAKFSFREVIHGPIADSINVLTVA